MAELAINRRQYLELEKIALGAFAPLRGFMIEPEFRAVVDTMRLPDGAPFPLPVVLDVTTEGAEALRRSSRVALIFEGEEVGELIPRGVYTCEKSAVARQIYGTDDVAHPGVAHFRGMGDWFIGGPVRLTRRVRFEFSDYELTPEESRAQFARRGWRTVVGFQTRNVPHRAHEHLLRFALEQADGLFIQPLVGRKKRGDYHPLAILAGYEALIKEFLPAERVLLGVLSTAMRYAGPREALFHAIIRRNYGCTHFVIGRDHAGVGRYYRTYEAHALAQRFDGELGIQILRCRGPFYCRRCEAVVTEQTCPHADRSPEHVLTVSGSEVRALLSAGRRVANEIMRPEVVESLRHVPLLVEEDEP